METFDDPQASPDGRGTFATGINDAGQVVGYYYSSQFVSNHGFLRSADGTYINIDDPQGFSTEAFGINNAGQVVGLYYDGSANHAFIATPVNVPAPRSLLLAAVCLAALAAKSLQPHAGVGFPAHYENAGKKLLLHQFRSLAAQHDLGATQVVGMGDINTAASLP